MSEGELRATARDFREKHNEQVADANSIEDDMTEYKEKYEAAQEDADEAQAYFAEKAAEVKDMDEDLLSDRFSVSELRTMVEDAEEAGEFAEESPEDDPDDDTKFSEKPGKAPVNEESTDFNEDRARSVLADSALVTEDF